MPSPLEIRAAAYLAKLPPAVAGNSGHSATFAAACRLVEFGLPFEKALPLLAAWNETHCQPKWTAGDLHHKLADAFKRTKFNPDFLAGRRVASNVARSPSRAARPNVTDQAESKQLAATILALQDLNLLPAATPASPMTAGIAAVAKQFNLMREQQNVSALAKLRGLEPLALMNAWRAGLLRFGNHYGKPAWFVLDKSLRNACARRMDGLPWHQGTPSESKATILKGSQAKWPIGIREAQEFPNILLCEGGPDFLAAFHFIFKKSRTKDVAPVAMLSGSYPIHTDAIRLFTGKRVRIFAHNDGGTGDTAAARWMEQIKHRATVDVFSFAQFGVKDLNDFARTKASGENLLP